MAKVASLLAILFFFAGSMLLGSTFLSTIAYQLKNFHFLSMLPLIFVGLFMSAIVLHVKKRYMANFAIMLTTAFVYFLLIVSLPKL